MYRLVYSSNWPMSVNRIRKDGSSLTRRSKVKGMPTRDHPSSPGFTLSNRWVVASEWYIFHEYLKRQVKVEKESMESSMVTHRPIPAKFLFNEAVPPGVALGPSTYPWSRNYNPIRKCMSNHDHEQTLVDPWEPVGPQYPALAVTDIRACTALSVKFR